MNDRIFIESNENLGILYNRYCKLPDILDAYLDDVAEIADRANKEGATPESDIADKLSKRIAKFKHDVEADVKVPEPVEVDSLKETINKVKGLRSQIEDSIGTLGKLRKQAKYGTNWFDGVLFRSALVNRCQDPEKERRNNDIIREISRAIDWGEKIALDLLNYTSQDINILTIVNKVYYRKIFEHGELNFSLSAEDDRFDESDNLLDVDIDNIPIQTQWSPIFDESEEAVPLPELKPNMKADDIMNAEVSDRRVRATYVPVYCITMSVDPKPQEGDDEYAKGSRKFAGIVKTATLGGAYSHALLGFDPKLTKVWSFDDINMFHEDDLIHSAGYTDTNIAKEIYVSVVFVTKEEAQDIKNVIVNFNNNHDKTSYDTRQIVEQIFGKTRHVSNARICSTFVGYLLNVANPKNVHRDYSMIRPEDITLIPRSFHVISFKNQQDLRDRIGEVEKRTKEIFRAHKDEIREYNNELPKVLMQYQMQDKKFIDKIFDKLSSLV